MEAVSVASVVDLMTVLFAAPVIQSRVKILHRERAAKPLDPTSVGSQQALDPLPHQFSSNMLLPCSPPDRSTRRTCFQEADVSTMSGLKEVDVMKSGNLSCLPQAEPSDGVYMNYIKKSKRTAWLSSVTVSSSHKASLQKFSRKILKVLKQIGHVLRVVVCLLTYSQVRVQYIQRLDADWLH
ncbi:hypothetical protein Q8A73_018171 [Channa argus]|nr:hypothetical protein Q8A73_018171 [Channa argus]